MKRRQSPCPISVKDPLHCYLKSQPMRVSYGLFAPWSLPPSTLLFQCDGETISLPNLQGIVVLSITSYAGGVNFWGSSMATTVSIDQRTGKEKGLTPLRPLRKESWTDWSRKWTIEKEDVGWEPLLAEAAWSVFWGNYHLRAQESTTNLRIRSILGVSWILNFPLLRPDRCMKGHALFYKEDYQ